MDVNTEAKRKETELRNKQYVGIRDLEQLRSEVEKLRLRHNIINQISTSVNELGYYNHKPEISVDSFVVPEDDVV